MLYEVITAAYVECATLNRNIGTIGFNTAIGGNNNFNILTTAIGEWEVNGSNSTRL